MCEVLPDGRPPLEVTHLISTAEHLVGRRCPSGGSDLSDSRQEQSDGSDLSDGRQEQSDGSDLSDLSDLSDGGKNRTTPKGIGRQQQSDGGKN